MSWLSGALGGLTGGLLGDKQPGQKASDAAGGANALYGKMADEYSKYFDDLMKKATGGGMGVGGDPYANVPGAGGFGPGTYAGGGNWGGTPAGQSETNHFAPPMHGTAMPYNPGGNAPMGSPGDGGLPSMSNGGAGQFDRPMLQNPNNPGGGGQGPIIGGGNHFTGGSNPTPIYARPGGGSSPTGVGATPGGVPGAFNPGGGGFVPTYKNPGISMAMGNHPTTPSAPGAPATPTSTVPAEDPTSGLPGPTDPSRFSNPYGNVPGSTGNPFGNIPGSVGNPYGDVPGATGDPYAKSGNSIVNAYSDKVAPQYAAQAEAQQNDVIGRGFAGGSTLAPSLAAHNRMQQAQDVANYGRNLGINAEQLQYDRGKTNDDEQWKRGVLSDQTGYDRGVQADDTAYNRGVAGTNAGWGRMTDLMNMLSGQGSAAGQGLNESANAYNNAQKNSTSNWGNIASIASMFF